jgi:hypothetical protein
VKEQEMSDDVLKFPTEAEKAKAIESFDEAKGSEDELQRIMAATIEPTVEGGAEADKTPPQSVVPDKTVEKPVEKPVDAAPATADEWAKSKGYNSFAEARKAFDEKEEALQRSQKFIKEKLEPQGTANDQYNTLMTRTQQLEAELNTLKTAPPAATKQEQVENQENKIVVLKQALGANLQKRKALVEELKADPGLAVDGDFLSRRLSTEAEKDDLDLRLVEEMSALQSAISATSKQVHDYTTRQELTRQSEQNERLYKAEMDEITSFAANPKYPEFAFTKGKDSRAVEGDYVRWANAVASAVYAGPVNMLRSQQDKAAVAQALAAVKAGDPEAINACRAAGIAPEPDEDVRKYLDICDLLNHRDGKKINPVTGQYEQQFRLVRDPATGGFRKDPVRMASLEDAYQHKMAVDGTYAERIKQSYVAGSKDMARAAQKRAAGPVELDNASGASAADVGLALTPADAMKELENIDEVEALRRKMAGDPTMYDRFEKALSTLETVKL